MSPISFELLVADPAPFSKVIVDYVSEHVWDEVFAVLLMLCGALAQQTCDRLVKPHEF